MGNFFKGLWNGVKSVAGAIGGPLVSGGLSLVGSLLGSNSQRNAQRSANRANMELAEYQYNKNLEMWNRQNEYNSPQAQMQRYKEAGLNPNLIYSQGSSGNASSAPSYNAPQIASDGGVDYGQAVGSFINAYTNVGMNMAQLNLMSQQGSRLGAQTAYDKIRSWQTLSSEIRNSDKWKIQRPFMQDYWRLKNDNMQADANNKAIQSTYLSELADVTRQRCRNLQLEYSLLRDKKTWYAQMLEQELKNAKVRHTSLVNQSNLFQYQGDRLVNENAFFKRNGYYPGSASSANSVLFGSYDKIRSYLPF